MIWLVVGFALGIVAGLGMGHMLWAQRLAELERERREDARLNNPSGAFRGPTKSTYPPRPRQRKVDPFDPDLE